MAPADSPPSPPPLRRLLVRPLPPSPHAEDGGRNQLKAKGKLKGIRGEFRVLLKTFQSTSQAQNGLDSALPSGRN